MAADCLPGEALNPARTQGKVGFVFRALAQFFRRQKLYKSGIWLGLMSSIGGGGVEVTIAQSRGAIDQGEPAPKGKGEQEQRSEDQDCMSDAQRRLFLVPPPPSSGSAFVVSNFQAK